MRSTPGDTAIYIRKMYREERHTYSVKALRSHNVLNSSRLAQYVPLDRQGAYILTSVLPRTTVTGASTGFGLHMARCALAHGDKVVATLRKPDALADFASKYPSSQLLVVQLDVMNPAEIKSAFQQAKAAFGRVDVVFNNAGYLAAGEAEVIPNELARKMFDTNFWGAAHVSQEAVRFFREENSPQGGHLIQNSASSIWVNIPLMGFYTASKCGK